MKRLAALLLCLILPLSALAEFMLPEGARLFQTDEETGYAIIELDQRYGAVDEQGNIVIPCVYIQPFYFSGGIALVRGERFTYLDAQGQPITEESWEYAFPFEGGFATVCENGLYGLIDMSGRFVLPCEYEPW